MFDVSNNKGLFNFSVCEGSALGFPSVLLREQILKEHYFAHISVTPSVYDLLTVLNKLSGGIGTTS